MALSGIRDPDDGDERDAANKRYVDKMIANIDLSDQIDNFVKKDGDQVQGVRLQVWLTDSG